ncbi:MAG: LysR family transcriptional regulator [Arenicella sp.]
MRKKEAIELGAMRIFSIVSESETLTHAGTKLGITQSAVSQAIKQLEEQIGESLIVKRSRPVQLTPGGKVLKSYVKNIISITNRMTQDVKMASSNGLASLNIGMISSFEEALGVFFIDAIKPYVAKVSVSTNRGNSLKNSLLNRDIDFMITADSLAEEHNIIRHAIIRDPFVILAPKNNSSNSIESIARTLPFINYNTHFKMGAQTTLIARRLSIELNTQYELDSTQTIIRFVAANKGWAITTALSLASYSKQLNNVRIINLSNGSNARCITQIFRKNEFSHLPEKFAEASRKIFSKEIAPELHAIAPWLCEQAYAIEEPPLFI